MGLRQNRLHIGLLSATTVGTSESVANGEG